MFNALNQAGITGRNTTMNLNNPNDPTTITNLPFNPDGSVIDSRSRPRGAGFGVATGFQDPANRAAAVPVLVLGRGPLVRLKPDATAAPVVSGFSRTTSNACAI